MGLINKASREINATLNWWGDPSGPDICNVVEETDQQDPEEIKGNIAYNPWLIEPYKPSNILRCMDIMYPIWRTVKRTPSIIETLNY